MTEILYLVFGVSTSFFRCLFLEWRGVKVRLSEIISGVNYSPTPQLKQTEFCLKFMFFVNFDKNIGILGANGISGNSLERTAIALWSTQQ